MGEVAADSLAVFGAANAMREVRRLPGSWDGLGIISFDFLLWQRKFAPQMPSNMSSPCAYERIALSQRKAGNPPGRVVDQVTTIEEADWKFPPATLEASRVRAYEVAASVQQASVR
jgi:hypothetical protein